jgi:pimeloyl-ACP methyl ester carboxylesterase
LSVGAEESGRGPLALFLHGGGLDRTIWREQLQALGDIRRCVAVDLPGHAGTVAGDFDLAEMLAALGADSADLVGHSLGAHVALAAWQQHPGAIRSLALFGVMFSADMDRTPPASEESVIDKLLTPDVSPALRERVRAMRARWAPASLAGLTLVPHAEQRAVVASISVPLLVASGDMDLNTPRPLSRRFAESNPSTRWVEIAGSGHLAPMEQPNVVSAILRTFWSEIGPG